MLTIQECRKINRIGNLNPSPIALGFLNYLCWFIYSIMLQDIYLIISSSGIFFGLFAVVSVLILLGFEQRLEETLIPERILYAAICFWTVMGFLMSGFVSKDLSTLIVGTTASILAIFSDGINILKIPTVIRTKDSSYLHAPSLLIGNTASFSWFIYGISLGDVFVFIPAGVNFTVNSFFLLLILMYPTPKGEERQWTEAEKLVISRDLDDENEEAGLDDSMNGSIGSHSIAGTVDSSRSLRSDNNRMLNIPQYSRNRSETMTSMSSIESNSSMFFKEGAGVLRRRSRANSETDESRSTEGGQIRSLRARSGSLTQPGEDSLNPAALEMDIFVTTVRNLFVGVVGDVSLNETAAENNVEDSNKVDKVEKDVEMVGGEQDFVPLTLPWTTITEGVQVPDLIYYDESSMKE